MAEFCIECLHRLNGKTVEAKKYILSKDLELCEGCGEYKRLVVRERYFPHMGILQGIYRTTRE